MAIQNFVSGGFYGKLGQLVGQRWKNKRIVRTYSIPHNPRTPAQQANRMFFGQCTKASQIAMQMNFRAPAWSDTNLPEWGLRVKRATELAKSTQKPLDMIPLFPTDASAVYTIGTITRAGVVGSSDMKFVVTGTLPEVERSISVLVGYWNAETEAFDLELFQSKFIPDSEPYFVLQDASDRDFSETTVFLICSNDDRDFNAEALFCPQTPLEAVETDWNDTIVALERDGSTFTIRFAQNPLNITASDVSAEVRAVSAGVWVNRTFTLQMSSDSTSVIGSFSQSVTSGNAEILAFPSGATIRVSGTVSVGARVRNPTTEDVQAFANDDLTREWRNQVSLSNVTETAFRLTFAEKLTANVSTYTIASLVGGDFTGARTQANLSASAVFNGTNSYLTVTKPDSGTISVLQLTGNSTATLSASVVSQGVTYSPTVQTAQAIPYLGDSLTVNAFPSLTFTMQTNGKWLNQRLGVQLGSKSGSRNTWLNAVNAAIESHWDMHVMTENFTQGKVNSTTVDDYFDPYSGTGATAYLGGWLTATTYESWSNKEADCLVIDFGFDVGTPRAFEITVGQAKFIISPGMVVKDGYTTDEYYWANGGTVTFR